MVLERLLSCSFALVLTVLMGSVEPSGRRHWEETATETIWRDRYTNCKYGYFVALASGMVAHGSHSPAPNHGFSVALPDVGRASEASLDEPRFLWVNAEYNVLEFGSLQRLAQHQLDLASSNKSNFRVAERKRTTLGGIPAIRFKVEYGSRDNRVVESEVTALRSGKDSIVYKVGLRSSQADYHRDEPFFEDLLHAFKLTSLSQGSCTND